MDGVIEDNYGFNLYYISGFKENTIRQLTIKQLPSIISTRILLREIPLSVYKCFGNLTQLDAETVALVIDKKGTKVEAIGVSTNENPSYSYDKTTDENGLYVSGNSPWKTIVNYTPVAITTEANRSSAEAIGYHVETGYYLASHMQSMAKR
ncbi:MAG: hypothetical protein MJY81_05090 [Bacteroidaceae bacterium]|nr:hypothetical protein [Bacteroidaceae bacterium]